MINFKKGFIIITDKIIIKYKDTTFSISKFIFNSHIPFLPKMKKGQTERTREEFLKLREITTKKNIREYFKSHHIENNYRSYAEYFIIEEIQQRHRTRLRDDGYTIAIFKTKIKELEIEIDTLKNG